MLGHKTLFNLKSPWVLLSLFVLWASGGAHANELTLGLIAPLSGQYAVFGEQLKHGAVQAVQDINDAGGINGQKLQLKIADDACDPKQAVTAASQLSSEGIKFVVGHYCSGSAIPASKIFMDEGVLLISPAATNPNLTDESHDLVFRVCGRDDRQGKVIGQYILNHFKSAKIGIIHDSSAYGRGIADEVAKTLNENGQNKFLFNSYRAGERDYSALVSSLKESGINVLFIGGYHTEAGLIARQLNAQNTKIQIIGADALVTDEYWSIAGPAAEGTLMTFGPDPRQKPNATTALNKLRQSGFEPEGYTLYAYAAVQVLASGISAAKSDDSLKVAAALRQGTSQTILGPIGFDAKGDVSGPTYVMYRWHNGKYAEVQE